MFFIKVLYGCVCRNAASSHVAVVIYYFSDKKSSPKLCWQAYCSICINTRRISDGILRANGKERIKFLKITHDVLIQEECKVYELVQMLQDCYSAFVHANKSVLFQATVALQWTIFRTLVQEKRGLFQCYLCKEKRSTNYMQHREASEVKVIVFIKRNPTIKIFCAWNQILKKTMKENCTVVAKDTMQAIYFIKWKNFCYC